MPKSALPVSYKTIMVHQQKDKKLLNLAKSSNGYTINTFHGVGKVRKLICTNDKIITPQTLQLQLVERYHTKLCHPGATCTKATISQYLTWVGMKKVVASVCAKCHTCQLTKRKQKKYVKVPPKKAATDP